jgi:c(7)-type cytochrome triheme protein
MNAIRRPWGLAILLLVSVAAAPIRLPDVVYDTSSDAPGPVRFDHTTHSGRVQNKCVSCHPQTFRIVRPTRRTSHAEMDAGRSCGACHDGKRAFGVQDAERCETCHDAGGAR